MKSDSYCTTFCNHPHRLSDGKPIGHECYVLPTAALHAEKEGKLGVAVEELQKWKNRKPHRGLRSTEPSPRKQAMQYEDAVLEEHEAPARLLAQGIREALNSRSETRRLFVVEELGKAGE